MLRVLRRAVVSFYHDQGTHHAAALTYYCLMSLFPAALLSVSLLGIFGEYPRTYLSIINYLHRVAPESTLNAIDNSVRSALRSKGTATGALIGSAVVTLYGTTGVLEAARRALNVVFGAQSGRGFFHRKLVDIISTFALMGLVLVTLTFMFLGGGFAKDLFGFAGLGHEAADIWELLRWPAALGAAVLLFSFVYYVTPDVDHRGFHWVTPGAVIGVAIWLVESYGFSVYVSRVADVSVIYGAFAALIVLVGWLWLTNVALLLGAEINAAIEHEAKRTRGEVPLD
jgi:membrane protein